MHDKLKQAVKEQEELIFRDLLRHAGYDVESISARNISEIKQELERQGYRIEVSSEQEATTYRLSQNGEFITGVAMIPEFEYKDGQARATIKKEFITK